MTHISVAMIRAVRVVEPICGEATVWNDTMEVSRLAEEPPQPGRGGGTSGEPTSASYHRNGLMWRGRRFGVHGMMV